MADLKLVPDDEWPGEAVDPYVRIAVAMAEAKADLPAMLGSDPGVLELLLELEAEMPQKWLDDLQVPRAYKGVRHVTADPDPHGEPPLTSVMSASSGQA